MDTDKLIKKDIYVYIVGIFDNDIMFNTHGVYSIKRIAENIKTLLEKELYFTDYNVRILKKKLFQLDETKDIDKNLLHVA